MRNSSRSGATGGPGEVGKNFTGTTGSIIPGIAGTVVISMITMEALRWFYESLGLIDV